MNWVKSRVTDRDAKKKQKVTRLDKKRILTCLIGAAEGHKADDEWYKSLSYNDQLQKFGLTTFETRRLRDDLIEVFKMFKGFDNIMLNDFFKLSSTTLRGHTLKIYKPQVHLDVRNFFSQDYRRME